jgi:hypothetical protein
VEATLLFRLPQAGKACLFFLLWMLPQRGMIPLNGAVL